MMAVGCSSHPKNLKTEIYNDQTKTWAILADYPYSLPPPYATDKPYVSGYASIYQSGAFYIFGGANNSNKIARLDEITREWSLAGSMIKSRRGHSVAYDGSTFIVVGGLPSSKTENCTLQGTVMTCLEQESPALTDYSFYPALFVTDQNFGC